MNTDNQYVIKAAAELVALKYAKSKAEIAVKCGMSDQYFTDLKRSKSRASRKFLDPFFELYPVNPEYLLNGVGEMILKPETVKASPVKAVPLIPISAVAGFPTEDNGGIAYADCEQYIVPEFDRTGYDFVIRVGGSSMYPKYSSGDILACKKITDIKFFQWGKVYVIDSSQGVLVKRVFECENEPEQIMLVSDNSEKYPPFCIPKIDIRSLSIVLGVIRLE